MKDSVLIVNAITAMCVWEHHIENNGEDNLEKFRTGHGAFATREWILTHLAPRIDSAWNRLVSDDPSFCFDWEFIPTLIQMIPPQVYFGISQADVDRFTLLVIDKLTTPEQVA